MQLIELTKTAVWERPNFYSSPAISRSLDAALGASRLTKDEIDLFDFYSCGTNELQLQVNS
jgi:hypothetical protein